MNLTNSATSTAMPAATPRRIERGAIAAAIAAFGLLAIVFLAFLPTVTATPADKITLLFLAVVAFICFWTPLQHFFLNNSGATAFALTAAMFIIYSLARGAGPDDGWALRFAALPDDTFPVSYAARIVILCAIITIASLWKRLTGWTKSLLCGALLLALLATFIFRFLSGAYPVGVTEVLDPTPLPHLGMQLLEYSAVALLCNVVAAHPVARRIALRTLPFVLLALWVWHQFMAPAEVASEEEAA